MDKFLDMRRLSGHQGQRHDTTDVHIWTINMHVQLELLSNGLDVLQALLEVGTRSANPDRGLVLDQRRCKFSQSTNDTLESGSDLENVSR